MRTVEKVFDFTDDDLVEIYRKSEAADVVTITDIEEDFLARVRTSPQVLGYPLPWNETHEHVRLRTGEVSVWAGINGHKKSTVLSQVAIHIAKTTAVGIASFEMKLEDTALMMCKQAGAVDEPSEDFARDFMRWTDDRVYLYRALGGVTPLEALGAISAMADAGCKVIIVDNLQFCGVTDDIERERVFVNRLVGLSEALKVHIAVVHHVRKPQSGGDEYVPTRFDVRGGGTIVDQAHLLFICWHNKAKVQVMMQKERGIAVGERGEKLLEQADFKLIVAKQRHAPFEGVIPLYEGKGQTFKRRDTHQNLRIDIPRT